MVLVPVFGLFFKRKVSVPTWIAVVLSVAALYLLCIKGDFSLAPGDLLLLVCNWRLAAFFSSAERTGLSFFTPSRIRMTTSSASTAME